MKNINFYFDNQETSIKDVYNEIEVKLDNESYSIFSVKGGGNCCLISNSGIEIFFDNETKRIGGLGGYIGKIQNFGQVLTNKPNDNGILCVKNEDDFVPNIAYSFNFNSDIIYDKVNHILLFGKYDDNVPVYKFLKNAYVQLGNDGALSAIFIDDIYLQSEKEIEK